MTMPAYYPMPTPQQQQGGFAPPPALPLPPASSNPNYVGGANGTGGAVDAAPTPPPPADSFAPSNQQAPSDAGTAAPTAGAPGATPGGMPDLASLMADPQMQALMADPQMQQLLGLGGDAGAPGNAAANPAGNTPTAPGAPQGLVQQADGSVWENGSNGVSSITSMFKGFGVGKFMLFTTVIALGLALVTGRGRGMLSELPVIGRFFKQTTVAVEETFATRLQAFKDQLASMVHQDVAIAQKEIAAAKTATVEKALSGNADEVAAALGKTDEAKAAILERFEAVTAKQTEAATVRTEVEAAGETIPEALQSKLTSANEAVATAEADLRQHLETLVDRQFSESLDAQITAINGQLTNTELAAEARAGLEAQLEKLEALK